MNLTDVVFILGAFIVPALIVLTLFLTREKPHKPAPQKKDEDFWPNYEPAERRKTK